MVTVTHALVVAISLSHTTYIGCLTPNGRPVVDFLEFEE